MRLEDVSAQLRPRGAWESVDLGFAMVRKHFPLILGAWFLTVVPLWAVILGLSYFGASLGALVLAIWWLKPIYDRVPLFVLSRSLFGAKPRLREVLKAWPGMLARRFIPVMLMRVPWLLVLPRFSWARTLLLPVIDLEQQRGKGYRERERVLLDRAGSTAGGLILACGLYEVMMIFGLLALVASIVTDPLGSGDFAQRLFELAARPSAASKGVQWALTAGYLVSVTLVEIFYVGAGFGLYLNCRTHLEGWDVEIAFRRLARRLGSTATALLAAGLLLLGGMGARAEIKLEPKSAKTEAKTEAKIEAKTETTDPKKEAKPEVKEVYPKDREIIDRVMKQDDFKIEKRKFPVSRMRSKEPTEFSPALAGFGAVIFWLVIAAVVGWLAWLIGKNLHMFKWRKRDAGDGGPVGPRTVMGLEITPDSLPADILAAARGLWQSGDTRGALSLLYRGSVAWLVNVARLGIRESDTEGDCLRHAGTLPNAAAVGYFSDLTEAWIGTAYASHYPPGERMERLLGSWPFTGLPGGQPGGAK